MDYGCTICCKRKRRTAGSLPAIERYLSRRIHYAYRESRRLGRGFAILSAKFGLLEPTQRIPWYDRILEAESVRDLASSVARQLIEKRVSRLVFYARPRNTSGWEPYYRVLEQACRRCRIPLEVELLDDRFV